jgi:hypothetical protein
VFGHGVLAHRVLGAHGVSGDAVGVLVVSVALACGMGCSAEGDQSQNIESALAAAGGSGRLVALDLPRTGGTASDSASDWERVLGAADRDVSSGGVSSNAAGDAIVAGYTLTPLAPEQESAASSDAFVAQYSRAGELLWTQVIGSPASDGASGVSCDTQGNVLVAGDTSGALDGPARGFGDGFVTKLSAEGELRWTRQLGTSEPDAAVGVSADRRGNVLVAGHTRGSLEGGLRHNTDADVWAAKYSVNGDLLWARQLGSSPGYDELAAGVSSDGEGNVLVAGRSFGDLAGESAGSADAFVAKLSVTGELLWLQQWGGAGHDAAAAVSADADGNVLVAGQQDGNLVGGPGVVLPGNPFVAKYSPAGELLWEVELPEGAHGAATSVTSDAAGHVLIAGYTASSVIRPNQGLYDSFVAELSPEGELLWAVQLGEEELDRATGLALAADGALLLTQDVRGAGEHGVDQALLLRRARPAGGS